MVAFGKVIPQNLIDIYNNIKFDKFATSGGYGFIYSKGSTRIPTLTETSEIVQITNH
jgi:hypothetical protein